MTSAPSFPPELLHQPPQARLAYFRALTIAHPLLLQVYQELRCAIRDAAPGSLILLQGPAGVGKTTLLLRLEQEIQELLLPELEQDVARLPLVRVEAVAPESGNFNWKDYFRRLLIALAEPVTLIDRKLLPPSQETQPHNPLPPLPHATAVSARLRYAAEQTLRQRRPWAVVIDDAQHLAMMRSGRKLLDQINIIKSIANLTQTTHVLTGTYELLALRHLNGQLSRRSVELEFPRYRADDPSHQQAFRNCLWTFQQHLPLAQTPDLLKSWDYCYERSIGCIGVLKDWLTRALAVALEHGAETLARPDLQRRALSVTQCTRMLAEAVDGERKLTETADAQQQLRQNLGLEREQEMIPGSGTSAKAEAASPSVVPSAPRRRAGQRNPVRDEIGVKRT